MREKLEVLRNHCFHNHLCETLRFKMWVEAAQDKKRQLEGAVGADQIANTEPNGGKSSRAHLSQL